MFNIPTGAITDLSSMASSVGTGTINNIAALSGVLAVIVVVLFSRGMIMAGLRKLGL